MLLLLPSLLWCCSLLQQIIVGLNALSALGPVLPNNSHWLQLVLFLLLKFLPSLQLPLLLLD